MPPKKIKKKEEEAVAPKKPLKKRAPAKPKEEEKPASNPEPTRSAPAASSSVSRRRNRGGSGGLLLFVVLIAIVAVVGVYVFQQRQTDTVASKLSELEGKFQDKIGEIEEGIGKVKEQAEKEAEDAVKEATTKTYTHAEYGYTLDYPTEYVITYISAGNDSHSGLTRFMREVDKVKYESLPEVGPRISFVVYEKPEEVALIDWLTENSLYTGADAETEFEQVEIGEVSGYVYELPGPSKVRTIALDAGNYFFLAIAASEGDEDDVDLFEDFDALLETLMF